VGGGEQSARCSGQEDPVIQHEWCGGGAPKEAPGGNARIVGGFRCRGAPQPPTGLRPIVIKRVPLLLRNRFGGGRLREL
jgi:hypothetical protein